MGKTTNKKDVELNIVYRNIRELKPYKKNAKKHPKEQVERIMNSIKQFGFFEHRAIAIDKDDYVVEGHGRILAAKKAGLTQVPTICLDNMTEEQIKAWRLIENKTAESSYDETLMNEEISELLKSDIDMEVFGFRMDALEDETIEVEPDVPFTEILNEENNYIVLKFNNKIDWLNAMGLFGIEKAKAYPTKKEGNKKSFGMRAGVGRVLDGQKALERVQGNEV
jgi:hypothetical protein|nr:MAG TPA: ParB protein [Caudoviricetes sp.]